MACGMLVALLLLLVSSASATDYIVGDKSGWVSNVDYDSWASGKTFKVNDKLEFNYAGGAHTVDEVSESDYKACAASNSLSTDSTGKTTITLKKAGDHFFICAIPGHCSAGMKLKISVKEATGAAASSPGTKSVPTPAGTSPSLSTPGGTPTGATTTTTPTTTGTRSAATTQSPFMAVLMAVVAVGLLTLVS